jgi:hypothetical protein
MPALNAAQRMAQWIGFAEVDLIFVTPASSDRTYLRRPPPPPRPPPLNPPPLRPELNEPRLLADDERDPL